MLVRGLNALAAAISTPLAAPVVAAARLRGGSVGSARGAASLVRQAVHTARDAGCTGTLVARADSAFCSAAFTGAVRAAGACFSVTVQMKPARPGGDRRHRRGCLDPDRVPPGDLG